MKKLEVIIGIIIGFGCVFIGWVYGTYITPASVSDDVDEPTAVGIEKYEPTAESIEVGEPIDMPKGKLIFLITEKPEYIISIELNDKYVEIPLLDYLTQEELKDFREYMDIITKHEIWWGSQDSDELIKFTYVNPSEPEKE